MLEVIALSRDDALAAEAGGAARLELTCGIAQDGLTPAPALVEDVLRAVRIPVRVMLRPRDSFSIQAPAELDALCALAHNLTGLPVDGFVLGFLRDGGVDADALTRLLAACAPRPVTFHRAFERAAEPFAALSALSAFPQIDAILCGGGPGDVAARVARLSQLHAHVTGRFTLLAGGGMDDAMIDQVLLHTGIRHIHIGRAARAQARWDAPVDPHAVGQLVRRLNAALGAQ
jgi:copper homeostasis protein